MMGEHESLAREVYKEHLEHISILKEMTFYSCVTIIASCITTVCSLITIVSTMLK